MTSDSTLYLGCALLAGALLGGVFVWLWARSKQAQLVADRASAQREADSRAAELVETRAALEAGGSRDSPT